MAELDDLLNQLLTALVDERRSAIRELDSATLEALVGMLGRRRDPESADVLALVDAERPESKLRKAARRELHRLASVGVHPSEAVRAVVSQPPPAPAGPTVEVTESWGTSIDPTGARALWLLAERPTGGVWIAGTVVSLPGGITDMELNDTTRKRFLGQLDEWRRDEASTWVKLPGAYAMQLVREGVDASVREGKPLPPVYARFRTLFGEAPSGPERALIYDRIPPLEARFQPDWLTESPALMREREVGTWFVEPAPALRERALEAVRATQTSLLVPGREPATLTEAVLREGTASAFTPTVCTGLARRLEETAYVFAETHRDRQARLAVAAAQGFRDATLDPAQHPLALPLVVNGFVRALLREEVQGRRAADIFLALVDEIEEPEHKHAPLTSRTGGLILPR